MRLWADNATATITDNPLGSGATTINLASGKGALFPSPTSPDYFIATLTQAGGTESSWEEVKVTARSSDALTVVRAQNGTSAASWASGSKCELRLTADWLTNREVREKVFNFSPASATFTGSARWYPPADITLKDVTMFAGVAPSIRSIIGALRKNGSITTSGITVAVAGHSSSVTADTTAVATTEYLTFDLTQADPTADNITVRVRYF